MRARVIVMVFVWGLAAGCGDDSGQGGDGGVSDGTVHSDSAPDPDGALPDGEAPQPGQWSCDPFDCGPSNGATVNVAAGGDLQAALDSASPGDTLLLEAGATYTGNFELPAKNGDGCITVRTATPDTELVPGGRAGPWNAGLLARVVSPGNGLPAIRTAVGAHHYRLVGLEVLPESPTVEIYDLIALGSGQQTSLVDVPHHLVIDRCYIHGWPDANFKRGIGLNSAHTCILSSTVSDFHSDFQDSQAIGGHNGPGPFKILNNRLEGGAENVMFGGGLPAIADLVPSDIEIRGNHFFKPLAWKAGDPQNTGYVPWVKNLFEIKNGRNVILDGNVLENNWVGADQHGFAIMLTPRSEGGQAPWVIVENVQITNNLIKHVGGGVALLGRDTGGTSQQTANIVIRGNLFEDIRQDYALDIVRVIQLTGINGLVVDHNTFVYGAGSWPMLRAFGDQSTGFVYTNNIIEYREGVWADCGTDDQALACALPASVFEGNVIVGGNQTTLPAGNFMPAALGDVGFVDWDQGSTDYHNYALGAGSPYAGQATDGTDPGFDPAAVDTARGISTGP